MLDTAGKDCIICGRCCAHIPRVRDERLNYYCRECYERAKSHRGLLVDVSDNDGLLLEETVDDFVPSEAVGAETGGDSGSISSAIGAEGPSRVVRLEVGTSGPPREEDAEQLDWVSELTGHTRPAVNNVDDLIRGIRSGALGPEVVGGTTLFLGGSGLIFYGYYALSAIANASAMMLQTPLEALLEFAYGVPAGIALFFAAWAIGAGLNMSQRRAYGPLALARWARYKRNAALAAAIVCLLYIGGRAAWESMESTPAAGATPFDPAVYAAPVAGVLGAALWLMLWPLIVLRWMKRSNVMLLARSWQ